MSRLFRAFEILDSSVVAALAALAACALGAELRGQCQYEISAVIQGPECGIFGFPPIVGTALSDNGEVVGWYTACTIGTDEAFYWSAETGFVTLDRPPGVFAAMASDISNEGTIVGTYQRIDIGNRGFVYKDGAWAELLPNEGGIYSWANAVSKDGSTVIGARTGGLGGGPMAPYQAHSYNVGTATFTDLGVMNGPSSGAADILTDDSEQTIVGFTGTDFVSLDARAFIHEMGQTTVLGPIPAGFSSYGTDLNIHGTLLGGGRTRNEDGATVHRAFTYADGEMTVLPLLPGHDDSRPGDVDDAGRAIGQSRSFSDLNNWRAWLWENGSIYDLNSRLESDLDVVLEGASSINVMGQILCNAKLDGVDVAIVLTPLIGQGGDLNHDCVVGSQDLMLMLEQWSQVESPADLNNDGIVGPGDLATLLSQWGPVES